MSLKMESAKYEWISHQKSEELDILRQENEKLYNYNEESTVHGETLMEAKQNLEDQLDAYKKEYNLKVEMLAIAETSAKNARQENSALTHEVKNQKEELALVTSQTESVTEKLKNDLQLVRTELTEQRKEMSRLRQENLTKDFKIHELKRCLREKEGSLAID